MNITLWIFQGVLAFVFLMAGTAKLMQPKEKMAEKMSWVEDFSLNQIRMIGTLETLGALGLVLPMLTGVLPVLTPMAAVGLGMTMVGAFLTQLRRNEILPLGVINVVLFAMASFVAFGRF